MLRSNPSADLVQMVIKTAYTTFYRTACTGWKGCFCFVGIPKCRKISDLEVFSQIIDIFSQINKLKRWNINTSCRKRKTSGSGAEPQGTFARCSFKLILGSLEALSCLQGSQVPKNFSKRNLTP